MLTSDLYAVFSQLLTGTLALVAVLFVMWLIVGASTFFTYLKETMRRSLSHFTVAVAGKETHALAIALALCALFGLGLTLQTVVDDLVDDQPYSSRLLAAPVAQVIGDETAYRFSALFAPVDAKQCKRPGDGEGQGDEESSAWRKFLPLLVRREEIADRCQAGTRYQPTGLGRELFADERSMQGIKPPMEVPFPVTCSKVVSSGNQCEVAHRFSRKLYYDALNFAVGRDVEGRLLARWQAQIDFLGGAATLSIWILAASAVYLACIGGRRLLRTVRPGRKKGEPTSRDKIRALLKIAAVAVFGVYVAGSGYALAQKSYVERVFGFYSSQVGLQDAFVSSK